VRRKVSALHSNRGICGTWNAIFDGTTFAVRLRQHDVNRLVLKSKEKDQADRYQGDRGECELCDPPREERRTLARRGRMNDVLYKDSLPISI